MQGETDEQPPSKIKKVLPTTSSNDDNRDNLERVTTPTKTLLDLNDDCLRQIMQNLPLMDCLYLALSSDRFCDLFAAKLSVEEFNFGQFKENFSLNDADEILSQFGSYIRRLSFDGNQNRPRYKQYAKLATQYCVNIEEVSIGFETRYFHLGLLGNYADRLTVLKLTDCSLKDKHCKTIAELQLLHHLDLTDNPKITGQYLTKLRNLEDLRIGKCYAFSTSAFLQISCYNRLKRLEINSCYLLNHEAFATLPETQTKTLMYLKVSNFYKCGDINIVASIKSLRHLEIIYKIYPSRNEDLLIELARLHKDTLKTLKILGEFFTAITDCELNCILQMKKLTTLELKARHIPELYLSRIAENCTELESLKVSSIARSITLSFLQEIRKNLKKLKQFIVVYPNKRLIDLC